MARLDERSAATAAEDAKRFFSEHGRQAGTEFANQLSTAVAKGDRDVEKALSGYQRSYRSLQDMMGNVRSEQVKLNDAVEKFGANSSQAVRETERLEQMQRRLADTTAAATNQYDRLKSAVNGATREHQNLFGAMSSSAGQAIRSNETVEKLTTNFASSTAAAAALGGVVGGALAMGFQGLVETIADVPTKFFEIGQEWDNLGKKLQFQTGLSGGGLADITNTVGELAKTTPASLGQLGNVAADVSRNLHLSGDELANVTQQITLLDEKSGQAPVNMHQLAQATKLFGVEGKDTGRFIDQLYTASARTGLSVDAMLATFSKSGTVMREAFSGMSAQQALGFFTQLDAAGVNLQTIGPAISRAVNDSTKPGEKGKTPADIIRDTVTEIDKLERAGDRAGAINLATKIFGAGQRGGGATFIDAIENGTLDLNNLTGALNTSTLSIKQQADATMTTAEKWQLFHNNLDEAMRPVSSALFNEIQPMLDKLVSWVQGHQSELISFFTRAGQAAIEMAGWISFGIGNTLKALGELGEGSAKALKGFADELTNVGKITSWIPGPLGETGRAIEKAGGKLGGAADSAETLFHGMDTGGNVLLNFATNTAPKLADSLGKAGEHAATAAKATELLKDKTKELPDSHEIVLKDNSPELVKEFEDLGFTIEHLPDGHISVRVAYTDQNGRPIDPAQLTTPGFIPATPGDSRPLSASGIPQAGGRAGGGPLNAPGPKGKDSALFWGADGEHVLTHSDVQAMGGHSAVHAFRDALHREGGGPLGQDVQVAHMMEGTPYSQAARTDCSGMVARIISASIGVGTGSLPSTKNMGQWLASLGFQTGVGGPGSISVGWYDKGGGPNSGHAAMTLSDGENAESGPAGKLVVGAGAAGASSSEFDHHMFLPQAWGDGAGGSGGGGGTGGGGGSFSYTAPGSAYGGGLPPGATAGTGPNGMPGYYTSDPKKVDAAQGKIDKLESDIKILEEKKSEETVKTKQSEKDKIDQEIKAKNEELTKARGELDAAKQGDFHAAHWNPASRASMVGSSTGGGSRSGGGSWGAPLAADFGVSKGVGGIAQNLTAFLGDLAFAPVFGALNAVTDTYGGFAPGGGTGLLGLASLAGGGPGGGFGGAGGGAAGGRGMLARSVMGTPGATGSAVNGSLNPALTPGELPKQMTGTGQGLGLSGGGILGIAQQGVSAAIGAAGMASDAMAPGAGAAAGIAAQIGMQELTRGITYGAQVGGILASGLMQTFLPDAPQNGWGAKILGGVMGAHPTTSNTADTGQQGQKGTQQGADGRPDQPGQTGQGDTTGQSAPPLQGNGKPSSDQDPNAAAGDTIHGSQFNGPVTVNNGPTQDQAMSVAMQVSRQQVGMGMTP